MTMGETGVVDLRTDAITQPTEAMWAAMRAAPLGWAAAGEDVSIDRLEATAVSLTDKDAALFVPTAGMANLVALMSYAERGEQIVLEASSHIFWSEEWSYASLCGLAARAIAGRRGTPDPLEVDAAIEDRRFNHQPRTAVVCLENTHNMAGGTVLTVPQTEELAEVAHKHNVPVHLDGARLFNAAVALDVPAGELVASVDSVTIGLNKGLSAPGGALLCGSREFIARGRANLKRLGGHSVPQAGIFAAAGLVALETMISRLTDDHRRARLLAQGLGAVAGITVDLEAVQTNIVMARVEPAIVPAGVLATRLAARGVRAYVYSADTLRFVTHRHVGDEHVQQVIQALKGEITCSTF